MARRYLMAMAAGAMAATVAAAAFSWIVDPLAIYGTPRIEGFNELKPALKTRSRIFKTITVARGGHDALIVGTSRAETGLDPGHPYFRGTRAFNAALGGESYDESLALVHAAAARGELRKVVAVLDFEVANAHYEGARDYVGANYRPWRPLTLALNLDTLEQAALTPFRQDRAAVLADRALWMADGRFVFPAPRQGNRALALASEGDYLTKSLFRGPHSEYALATSSSQPMQRVRDLVAFAHSRGIDLVLVIAPAHARQWETLAAAGLWSAWETWKRELVALDEEESRRARRPPFPLWDFSGYNDVTTERFPALGDPTPMRWYYESSHFTPEAGARMLERIGGARDDAFGVRLTPLNLEAHLAATRAARAAWREANPLDAAEIALLAREAMSVRSAHQ